MPIEDELLDSLLRTNPYVIELQAAVIKVESRNTALALALVVLAVLVLAAAIFFLLKMKRYQRRDRLTKNLLKGQAEALPQFADKVNKLSGKSIKLSMDLYDEFQDAINAIKEKQHNNQAVIVNDEQFAADYPRISRMKNLNAMEKLVAVLYEEGFETADIALFLGTTNASIRSVKSRIKTKMNAE